MSQIDKLLKRILSLDKNIRFDELRKVLESYGYTIIKKIYVEMVKEVVESEDHNEENG